jgi:hypothetical protein
MQVAAAAILALPLATLAPAPHAQSQAAQGQAASAVEPLHFHHVHLNAVDPKAAADYYPKPFAQSATRTTFNGFEAVKTGNVYILFTKVARTPPNELTGAQTSVWHFGWNTPDSYAYNKKFRDMGLKIAQMWDAADGKLVDMSSDTLPGLPTQEQILAMREKGTQPTRQGGFGYLRGPDGAMIENAQGRQGEPERFNHVHMYHEHPRCAMEWYAKHLGAQMPGGGRGGDAGARGQGGAQARGGAPAGPVPATSADCDNPRTVYAPPTWPSFAKTGFVRDPAGGVTFDDISISIRPWPGGGLVDTRGHIVDHWALSTSNLDQTVARLKGEGVKFLEEIHPWGTSRAAMIQGPDRIAIELVEIK